MYDVVTSSSRTINYSGSILKKTSGQLAILLQLQKFEVHRPSDLSKYVYCKAELEKSFPIACKFFKAKFHEMILIWNDKNQVVVNDFVIFIPERLLYQKIFFM